MVKKIFLIVLFLSLNLFAQNKIIDFVNHSAKHILERAHSNSTFISDSVKLEETDEEGFDYLAVLIINYKGFIKLHTLTCYIYFSEGPQKFIWGYDSNAFKIQTDRDIILEELKENWRNIKDR